jgi:hypothetical protein
MAEIWSGSLRAVIASDHPPRPPLRVRRRHAQHPRNIVPVPTTSTGPDRSVACVVFVLAQLVFHAEPSSSFVFVVGNESRRAQAEYSACRRTWKEGRVIDGVEVCAERLE